MANSDKNIVITPNIGSSTANSKMVFSGADASTSAQNITLQAYPTNNGTLSFEGSAGQLFSITNSLTGLLFAVNDISGIPSIEVFDSGIVKLGYYGGKLNIGGPIGLGTTPSYGSAGQVLVSQGSSLPPIWSSTGGGGGITGGTTNYVPKFSSTTSVTSSPIYITPSTNRVNIGGTVDQGYGLTVTVPDPLGAGAYGIALVTQTQTNGVVYSTMYSDSTGAWIGSDSIHDLHLMANGARIITATTTGKVGINTSNPLGGGLHVSNGNNLDSGDFEAIVIGANVSGNARTASFIKGTSSPYDFTIVSQNYTNAAGSLIFKNGPSEHMRINASGYVGINTAAPVSSLDVNGVITSSALATNLNNTAPTSFSSALSSSNNTVTVNNQIAHGLLNGYTISVDGVSDPSYNGVYTITKINNNSFSYLTPNSGTSTLASASGYYSRIKDNSPTLVKASIFSQGSGQVVSLGEGIFETSSNVSALRVKQKGSGPTITAYGSDSVVVAQSNSTTANVWSSRIISNSHSAGLASFLGTYNNSGTYRSGVFSHNSALSAWTPLHINTADPGTYGSGGNIYMSHNVGIGTSSSSPYASTNRGVLELNGANDSIISMLAGGSSKGYLYASATGLETHVSGAYWVTVTGNTYFNNNILIGTTDANMADSNAAASSTTWHKFITTGGGGWTNYGVSLSNSSGAANLSFWGTNSAAKRIRGCGINGSFSSTTAGSEVSYLEFFVMQSGVAATKMMLNENGNLGLGTNSFYNNTSLDTGLQLQRLEAKTLAIVIDNQSSNAAGGACFGLETYGGGWYIETPSIGAGATWSNPLRFYQGRLGTLRLSIDGTGGLILAGDVAQKATGTTWSNPSDIRLKDNVQNYTKGINELMQIQPRTWIFNGKGGTQSGLKGLGVVANEIETVLPDTVTTYQEKLNAEDETTTEIKKFDATEITWLLVNAVKELKAELDAVKAELNTLKGN